MKNIFVIILSITSGIRAQTHLAKNDAVEDQTKSIQSAFNNASTKTVLIDGANIVIKAEVQTILISNGENVLVISCNFRNYGATTPLIVQGNRVFSHCYFSGPFVKK
jgi:hypothetical protein